MLEYHNNVLCNCINILDLTFLNEILGYSIKVSRKIIPKEKHDI